MVIPLHRRKVGWRRNILVTWPSALCVLRCPRGVLVGRVLAYPVQIVEVESIFGLQNSTTSSTGQATHWQCDDGVHRGSTSAEKIREGDGNVRRRDCHSGCDKGIWSIRIRARPRRSTRYLVSAIAWRGVIVTKAEDAAVLSQLLQTGIVVPNWKVDELRSICIERLSATPSASKIVEVDIRGRR